MEGIGSRLGRASSRYGPAPVFSGPVRKWKKQWVHVSSSPSTLSYQSNNGNGNNHASALLLCRWTPVTSTNSGDSDNNSVKPDERPRRKFRYTPIVVLEEKKKGVSEKADDESTVIKTNQSTLTETSESEDVFEKTGLENLLKEDIQESNVSQFAQENKSKMDLDLCLKGLDDDDDDDDSLDSDGENKEAKLG